MVAARWSPTVRTIVEPTTQPLGPFDLYDVATLPRWWSGRVVLMGDAVHAVSPHAGQGASMALEDAIVLAGMLKTYDSPQATFAVYEAKPSPKGREGGGRGTPKWGSEEEEGPLVRRHPASDDAAVLEIRPFAPGHLRL